MTFAPTGQSDIDLIPIRQSIETETNKREHEEFKNENKKLLDKLNEELKKNAALNIEVTRLRTELDASIKKLASKEKRMSILKTDFESVKTNLQSVKSDITLESQKSSLNDKAAILACVKTEEISTQTDEEAQTPREDPSLENELIQAMRTIRDL